MAQPGKAPTTGSALQITITHNPTNDQWDANPGTPAAGAAVNNQGQVTFHDVPQVGCRIYTSPADAFESEPADGCEQLPHGNTTLTLASGVDDSEVLYCVCGPNEACTPTSPKETGGYSIQVGTPPEGGKK